LVGQERMSMKVMPTRAKPSILATFACHVIFVQHLDQAPEIILEEPWPALVQKLIELGRPLTWTQHREAAANLRAYIAIVQTNIRE
jgi:hypothetical protein